MLLDRIHRISIKETLKALFESPPAESVLSAFNVYSEEDMRNANKGSFRPTPPFIFITDARIAPTLAQLPFIAIDATPRKAQFQLGDRRGRLVSADLHIFGRSRGERDDLGSFIADYLTVISVKNYNEYEFMGFASEAEMCKGEIVDEPSMAPISIGDEESLEGSLDNWLIVSLQYQAAY